MEIRNIRESDGKNPFEDFEFWIGSSSKILGISRERVFNKIVQTDKEQHWVQVKMTFFVPMRVEWKKL